MKAFKAMRKLFIIGPTAVLESTISTIRIGSLPSVTRTTSRFAPFSLTWKSSRVRFSTGAPPVSSALTHTDRVTVRCAESETEIRRSSALAATAVERQCGGIGGRV